MRSTARLLANVKSAAKYLEPNTPTGLTGLTTHPAPRPALLYTYRQTLNKLAQLPATSVYRQSAEALTKHRLEIIESTKPAGYDEWFARVQKQIEASPEAYEKLKNFDGSVGYEKVFGDRTPSWDGEYKRGDGNPEGPSPLTATEKKARMVEEDIKRNDLEDKEGVLLTVGDLEREPPLDAEQISAIETKIAAGLIEEVIQVAEGELILVDEMLQSRVWEPLEEKAAPGQWEYFERGDLV